MKNDDFWSNPSSWSSLWVEIVTNTKKTFLIIFFSRIWCQHLFWSLIGPFRSGALSTSRKTGSNVHFRTVQLHVENEHDFSIFVLIRVKWEKKRKKWNFGPFWPRPLRWRPRVSHVDWWQRGWRKKWRNRQNRTLEGETPNGKRKVLVHGQPRKLDSNIV